MIHMIRGLALAGGIGTAALTIVTAATAQAGPYDYGYGERPPVGRGQPAALAVFPLAPGVGVIGPDQKTAAGTYVQVPHYQGPDGTYDSLTDLSRDINGVPCGIGCQSRALKRWGYSPL